MKKILSIVLVIAMVLGFGVVSYGASSFTDITDDSTANAVEVLKLMGVVDGVGDGKYNPAGTLTRSEFTKLAVASTHSDADLSKYKSMTIYPDVKASEWFAPYINMASKELKIILGGTDGLFHPERTISAGEAVTIILRLIGFDDSKVGGVWPYGHFQFATDLGLLAGTSITSASATISRADAAKLFVNSIYADAHQNKSVFHLSAETYLVSVNAGAKTLRTSSGSYATLKSISGNGLIGKAGYVVMDAKGNALSFIPKSLLSYDYPQTVVLKSAGASVLDALAGRKDYTIYKNGAKVTADKVKSGDVAVYIPSDNKIVVCDTTVYVYYDSCVGSPSEPVSIKALGGRTFEVLPCAISSLSSHKPGTHMTLALSSDGRVAAVSGGTSSNGVFIVSYDGKADLVCGGDVLDYNLPVIDSKYYGRAVKVSYETEDKISFELLSSSEGTLKVSERKLGSKKIAENALVFNNGEIATLEDLLYSTISYARTNANGEVDLIVAADSTGGKLVAGKVTVISEITGYDNDGNPVVDNKLHFEGPDGLSLDMIAYDGDSDGFYVGNYNGSRINFAKKLNHMGVAKKEDFTSNTLVNVNNTSKAVRQNVTCYNADLKVWTSLEEALAYGRSFTCYGRDNIVYLISYTY